MARVTDSSFAPPRPPCPELEPAEDANVSGKEVEGEAAHTHAAEGAVQDHPEAVRAEVRAKPSGGCLVASGVAAAATALSGEGVEDTSRAAPDHHRLLKHFSTSSTDPPSTTSTPKP